MQAMQQHASSAGVQEQGCGALLNLAVGAENRKRIAAKGGIEAIVKRTAVSWWTDSNVSFT